MPRLLPRLLETIAETTATQKKSFPFDIKALRNGKKSLYKPIPPRPSFHPSNHPRSILLAPSPNPITNSWDYVRHKTLPPRVRLSKQGKSRSAPNGFDRPREMTEDERRWWSSPYLRMLSSPIRRCIVSDRLLPSDFLVRLGPMLLPRSRLGKQVIRTSLLPDGLQHPKFTARRAGRGVYVSCYKDIVSRTAERGSHKRWATNVTLHVSLGRQIAHLLRVRVLQELELLADHLQFQPKNMAGGSSTIIRRLTRGEWSSIKTSGVIPYEGAVAVLVVPPPNRNPITKKRPEGSMSPLPLEEDSLDAKRPAKPLPPLSVLHSTSVVSEVPEGDGFPDILPNARTPLYNGLALFPARPQRAALHTLLTRLLSIEGKIRFQERDAKTPGGEDKWVQGDKKPSHAFLLSSDAGTVKRADVAAVAVALWRVRMFEGGGWDSGTHWVR